MVDSLYNIIMGDMKNQLHKTEKKIDTTTDEKEKEKLSGQANNLKMVIRYQESSNK